MDDPPGESIAALIPGQVNYSPLFIATAIISDQ